MLSAADLAGMRATLDGSLPDSCAIVRDVRTSNGGGGQSVAPSTIATVECRISPLTDNIRNAEIAAAERISPVAPWIVTLPQGTDVAETDRIESGGREFEVSTVLGARSWEISRRVICRMINGGAG